MNSVILNDNGCLINNRPREYCKEDSPLRNGWEMLHNEAVYSGVYGKLQMFQGLSYFFDGKNVIFNGFRLAKSNLTITKILTNFSKEYFDGRHLNFDTINYWGIEEPEDWIHPCFTRKEKEKPNEFNRDVILKLNEINLQTVYNLRFVKKAISSGLKCIINNSKQITESHHKLIKLFYENHQDIDEDGIKYIENWQQVLYKKDSILLEIYKGNVLTGMVILNLFLKHMPTYAYGFFDNTERGTSDIAYAAMIEYCKLREFIQLDLGYSVKKSLLSYKLKWGPVILRKAPWYVTWIKN